MPNAWKTSGGLVATSNEGGGGVSSPGSCFGLSHPAARARMLSMSAERRMGPTYPPSGGAASVRDALRAVRQAGAAVSASEPPLELRPVASGTAAVAARRTARGRRGARAPRAGRSGGGHCRLSRRHPGESRDCALAGRHPAGARHRRRRGAAPQGAHARCLAPGQRAAWSARSSCRAPPSARPRGTRSAAGCDAARHARRRRGRPVASAGVHGARAERGAAPAGGRRNGVRRTVVRRGRRPAVRGRRHRGAPAPRRTRRAPSAW